MGALKSIILGSVAVKLLQSLSFIPIIIVGQVPPVKKILLAVDTSLSSMKAVEFVTSFLGGHGYEACNNQQYLQGILPGHPDLLILFPNH